VKRNAHRLKVIEELVAKCTSQQEAIKDLVMTSALKSQTSQLLLSLYLKTLIIYELWSMVSLLEPRKLLWAFDNTA